MLKIFFKFQFKARSFKKYGDYLCPPLHMLTIFKKVRLNIRNIMEGDHHPVTQF